MAGKLEVSFNSPQCGWMSIGFRDDRSEFNTTTAHAPHAEALPELMRILGRLTDSSTPENDYMLKWNRDPEEFDFHFIRDGGEVTLQISEYPTEERHSSEKQLVFEYSGSVDEVVAAFKETFDQLYADRDTDEFEFNWRQPFPLAEYEEFRRAVSTK